MDRRWETASITVMNLAYAAAVVVMVVMAIPPVRAGLLDLCGRQVHAWRLGRWLGSRSRPPE